MVKSTGIVRKVDELGRIVIPIELRRTLDIGIKDSLEIYVEDDQIILKKYMPACAFCSNASGITVFKGKNMLRVPLRAQQTQLIYIITALKPRRNSAGVFHLHGYAAGRGNIPEKIA